MASLESSVGSLRSSLSLLNSSISLLDSGVSDLPRLRKVIATQQHFELLPEPSLREAQQGLLDEITPAITGLLGTAESQIAELGRREESLKARTELLDGRLNSDRRPKSEEQASHAPAGMNAATFVGSTRIGSIPKGQELKRLKQRKERLQYAVSRLELESRQRQRELRKSMAVMDDS